MRSYGIKWLVGSAVFFLPAVIAVIGKHLDRSSFSHDAAYSALIPMVCWGSLFLAAVIPAVFLLTARMSLPRRVGLTAGVWCLLLLEIYVIFVSVVAVY